MADIADVMDALATMAYSAIYVPPLPSTTTLTGKPVAVGQGWPLAEDIDKSMKSGRSIVSIYAVPGSSSTEPQVFDFDPAFLVPPVHNLQASLDGLTVTLDGNSVAGEYATIILDGKNVYSHASAYPEAAARVLAALLEQIQVDYPNASQTNYTLSATGAFSVDFRLGNRGTVAQKIHRQKVQFRIIVWSPNPADRTMLARAIDVAVKQPVRITLPDTSAAIVTYQGTNLSDKEENEGVYRRDILFNVLFDTIDEIEGFEVTSVQLISNVLPDIAFTA